MVRKTGNLEGYLGASWYYPVTDLWINLLVMRVTLLNCNRPMVAERSKATILVVDEVEGSNLGRSLVFWKCLSPLYMKMTMMMHAGKKKKKKGRQLGHGEKDEMNL